MHDQLFVPGDDYFGPVKGSHAAVVAKAATYRTKVQ